MKKKNRRQVRKQADTAGAREKAFEAEIAKCVKATSVVNDAEALALSLLADAGWQIESLEGGHGRPYQFLVSADGACEQIVEAKSALGLVKAVRELGTEIEAEEEYLANLARSVAQADAGKFRPLRDLAVMQSAKMLAEETVLVNGYDGDTPNDSGNSLVNWEHAARNHQSTKVIELPALQPTIPAGLPKQVRATIEMAHSIYVSGRGDIVVLDQGENPLAGEGTPVAGSFIQIRDLAESIGMVFRGNGGYNGNSGQFEYPLTNDAPANLFPHPATSLFRAGTRVERDPLSGAFVAPRGKTFELVNQVMGLVHHQKTIRSAAWAQKGWVAQVVTL